MEERKISRCAFGSVAKLGDLYDARCDKLCGISILKECAPASAIQSRDNPCQDTKFMHSDTYSDKFETLDVQADLKLSVLCGLVALEGSGHYLRDEKSSKRAVRCTLMRNIITKVEELDILDHEIKECIAMDALREDATHVVVGISWGANLIISAEHSNSENEPTMEVVKVLQAQLAKSAFEVSGKPEVSCGTAGVSIKEKDFSLNIYGDVLPDEAIPQTIQGASELMKKLPTLIKEVNDGKGKPLHYVLLPLSVLSPHLQIEMGAEIVAKSLSDETIDQFVHVFDNIRDVKQQLNDLHTDVLKYDLCLSENTRKRVEDLKVNADLAEAALSSEMAKLLVEVRSGRTDESELENLCHQYDQEPHSAQNVQNHIRDEFDKIHRRTNLYKRLIIKHGVNFVRRTENFLVITLLEYPGRDAYVLFSQSKAQLEDKELWSKQIRLFLRLIKESKPARVGLAEPVGNPPVFFYVDVDIVPKLFPHGDQVTVIQHFRNGKCISANLVDDYEKIACICHVKSSAMAFAATKPDKRTALELRCPSSLNGQCESDVHKWICFKCETEVEYGFDDYFYCKCGKGKAETYSYRCISPKHGTAFNKFRSDETTLKELLGQLRPMKMLNVLILGETGVGKSTWINGIVNYLHYESLEDAEKGELKSVIATSFVVLNDDYEEVVVKTGSDDNEDSAAGQSATQFPKSYTFPMGDTLVRLIDTPGIGDVRGIAQDKINFERILNHLSHITELHGVCILLKPNNARLTVVFQFCIKEFLTHLHRDASKNIVFCFTNARSTFYKPGDTYSALKQLLLENKDVEIPLSKSTMYCMDNEAFRFLAAVKHGIQFDGQDRINFSASWDKSVEETKRLLDHIKSLTPHTTKDTLSLNDARKLITELTKPMADVSQNIHENIAVVENKKKDIDNIDKDRKDLSNQLMVPTIDLVAEQLGYPRTVCGASKCIEIITGVNGIGTTNYKQVCHDKCNISGVSTGTKNQPQLTGCAAMTGPAGTRYCYHCGCPWFEHMHQTYKTTKVQKMVEDATTKNLLSQKEGNIQAINQFIETLELKKTVLESEQEVIRKVSVEFASFLYQNAITPYNDMMSDYLDHLIKVEEGKVRIGNNRTALVGLHFTKKRYDEEVKVLQQTIASSQTNTVVITPQRIDELVKKLYDLPETGPQLKRVMEVAMVSNRSAASYQESSLVSHRNFNARRRGDKSGSRWTWRGFRSLNPFNYWNS